MFERPDIQVSLSCRRRSVGGGGPMERRSPLIIALREFDRQFAFAIKVVRDIYAAVSCVWPPVADRGRVICVDVRMQIRLDSCVLAYIDLNYFKHPSA